MLTAEMKSFVGNLSKKDLTELMRVLRVEKVNRSVDHQFRVGDFVSIPPSFGNMESEGPKGTVIKLFANGLVVVRNVLNDRETITCAASVIKFA